MADKEGGAEVQGHRYCLIKLIRPSMSAHMIRNADSEDTARVNRRKKEYPANIAMFSILFSMSLTCSIRSSIFWSVVSMACNGGEIRGHFVIPNVSNKSSIPNSFSM